MSVPMAVPRGSVDETLGESSASDSEKAHALEVVFGDSIRRRKSSMVGGEEDRISRQISLQQGKARTACFVHSLLEKHHKLQRQGSPARDNTLQADVKCDKDGGPQTSPQVDAARLETHSRLLTKRQLADMAVGVRELSKQLGSVRMRLKVTTVFILTKAHDETLIAKTREMVEWILSKDRSRAYIVYVENTLEHNDKFDAKGLVQSEPSIEGRLKYWTNELAAHNPQMFDLGITLGGDGTLLYASWLFQRTVPPILSFSLGSLGFLTKFDFCNFRETLTKAFREGMTVSLRLRFEATIMQTQKHSSDRDLVEELVGDEAENEYTHRPGKTFEILNDIVIDRGPNPTMSALEIFGDDEHFTTVQADGVCVATPTGSTAYNLAAGGSLCHPDNPVMLLTAICAHTLSFRPIILPDTIVLRVGVPYDARTSSWVSFDGRERVELQPGDYVTISASRYPFANVLPHDRHSEDWIGSISRTLNWNSRQKQKAFKEWESKE